jgi:crotonobetainyl-CoA:carnitine CoA-transferase CaiB-like acyl-CoA transferase
VTESALSGLRVIDLSQGIAGPYCTKLLADAGAEVIKIEPPEGDYCRRLGPFPGDVPHPEKGGLFLFLNTSKKSVTLDVSVPSGQVVLKKLLDGADVLVESERPGVMASRGLGFEDLRERFPGLVYASMTPFGQTGPYRDWDGNSLIAMAVSTIMYGTGDPDREPLTTGGCPGDFLAGIQLWIGVLAALAYRARTGEGQHVDVSMAEACAAADEYNAAMYAFQGAVRRRYYSRHIFGYPNDILPCKDGYVVVIPGAGGFPTPGSPEGSVSPMALLLGDPDLDKNPLFLSMGERMLKWREFDALIEPWLREHTAKEIVEFAQALRMPFAYVPTAKDLLEDPHLEARRFFLRLEHPDAGALRYPGAPFRMTETPLESRPAPRKGEHTAEELRKAGYDREELAILADRGVI